MNDQTKAAVTKALDSAILNAAHESLEELVDHLDEQRIANSILRALSALRDLQRGIMPQYDPLGRSVLRPLVSARTRQSGIYTLPANSARK